MKNDFPKDALVKLIPEMKSLLQLRYRILQIISISGPVGRRVILDALKVTEREVRKETEFLKNQQFIQVTQKGMICTQLGKEILEELKVVFQEISGLAHKEKALANLLGIERVIIVPGNIEEDSNIKQLIGKESAQLLMDLVKKDELVAVTGGSSVAALTDYLTPVKALPSVTFISARGSIAEELNLQANTLVSQFASKCQANYKTLYLPENLSKNAYETMKQEPIIKEILDAYEKVDVVIHGIGIAKDMAERRNSEAEVIELLKEKGAVGEAFGYYFDELGQIIYHINTIGIQLEQVKKSRKVIAVAGGAIKAKAIQAYFKNAAKQTTLITDEGAANAIVYG